MWQPDPVLGDLKAPGEHITIPSAWHGHVPFARWLVAILRPRRIVELGVYHGGSYFAMCEAAVKYLPPQSCPCYGIDTWRGDPMSGNYGEDVFAAALARNQKYRLFSTLMRMTFCEAAPRFAGFPIDLLHIDGNHSYEAVSRDWQVWRPLLAPDSIAMFHDVNCDYPGFGTRQFWSELHGDKIMFPQAFGLGVLRVGKTLPELFDSPERAEIVKYFGG